MNKRPHEKLIVWQEAYKLCLHVYSLTKKFPSDEKFGLTSQMRRSAYSVPINIAEGNSRRTAADKGHFMTMAHSSLEELHCESSLAFDLGYISKAEYVIIDDYIQRTSFLLHKLIKSIRSSSSSS